MYMMGKHPSKANRPAESATDLPLAGWDSETAGKKIQAVCTRERGERRTRQPRRAARVSAPAETDPLHGREVSRSGD